MRPAHAPTPMHVHATMHDVRCQGNKGRVVEKLMPPVVSSLSTTAGDQQKTKTIFQPRYSDLNNQIVIRPSLLFLLQKRIYIIPLF